jgi:hypothetical protein
VSERESGFRKCSRVSTKCRERLRFFADFFTVIPQSGEFLNHIVTSDETWVSFVSVETKEHPKPCMHTHSLYKPKNLNECCIPVRKLMATDFLDRKGVLMVEFKQ